jgi:hypothetical protein
LICGGGEGRFLDRNRKLDLAKTYLIAVTQSLPPVRLEPLSVHVGASGAFQVEGPKTIVIAQQQTMTAADRATFGPNLTLFVSTD